MVNQLKEIKILKWVNTNLPWVITIIIQLLLILLCFANLTDVDIEELYYNTDYLYLPSLYTDIFIDGNSIQGWKLAPSPYFFPDMILYFILFAFSQNVGVTIILFSFIQLLLIQIFFYKLMGLLIDDKKKVKHYFLLSAFFIQLFLLAGAIFREPFASHLILIGSAHMGAVLCSLVSFYLFGKFWKTQQYKYLWVLVLIMLLSIFSDRLYLIHTVFPLFIFTIFYFILKKGGWPLFIVVLAAVAGWLGFIILSKYLVQIPDAYTQRCGFKESIFHFLRNAKWTSSHSPYTFGLLILHLVILALSPMALFRFKNGKRALYFIFIFSAAFSFIFPILYGFLQNIETFRYIIHSYVFLFLIFSIALGAVLKFRSGKKGLILFYGLYMAIILFFSFKEIRFSKIRHFVTYKNEHILLVEQNSSKLKNGIGNYWFAKGVYTLGNKKTRVVSMTRDFKPFLWQANVIWYIGKKNQPPPIFNFSINLRPDIMLGPPIDSIKGKENTLFIYPDFVFTKSEDDKIYMSPISK